jgi:hypothetical protein
LARQLDDLLIRAANTARDWALAGVSPLTGVFRQLSRSGRDHATANLNAHAQTGGALQHLRFAVVPRAVREAESYAQDRIDSAVRYAWSLWQLGRQYTDQRVAAVASLARQLYALAVRHADQVGEYVRVYAEELQRQALRYAEAGDRADQSYAQRLAEASARYAQALSEQANAYSRELQAVSEADARSLARESQDYARALSQRSEEYARGLARDVATYAQALSLPLAQAVTALERSPCLQRCQVLGQLGAELEGLDLGALLALVVAAAADAPAVARELDSVLAPELEDVGQSLRGLLVG